MPEKCSSIDSLMKFLGKFINDFHQLDYKADSLTPSDQFWWHIYNRQLFTVLYSDCCEMLMNKYEWMKELIKWRKKKIKETINY